MTQGSLFDGFGGMRRGFEDAGFETKWTVDLLNGQDITKLDPADFERVDLISGGPVCRKTSRAAAWHQQRTNESLWPHMLRFIEAQKPGLVAVEQPASVDRSLILGWVADLERCGYGVAGRIIDSKHWVPQQRARWYLIASLGANGMELLGTVPTVCQAEYLQGFRRGDLHSWAREMLLRSQSQSTSRRGSEKASPEK